VDSLSLDVFSPPRQDWIDGTDAYLRGPGPAPQGRPRPRWLRREKEARRVAPLTS
jgi:hypothetical protein